MQVEYEFNTDGPFKTDYPNFYYRICNLQDIITAYCKKGSLYGFPTRRIYGSDAPQILRVFFDDAKAKRYEQMMQRFIARYKYRSAEPLPFPKFPVALQVDVFLGTEYSCVFDFSVWDDQDALTKFCDELKQRHDEVYLGMLR